MGVPQQKFNYSYLGNSDFGKDVVNIIRFDADNYGQFGHVLGELAGLA